MFFLATNSFFSPRAHFCIRYTHVILNGHTDSASCRNDLFFVVVDINFIPCTFKHTANYMEGNKDCGSWLEYTVS